MRGVCNVGRRDVSVIGWSGVCGSCVHDACMVVVCMCDCVWYSVSFGCIWICLCMC